MSDCANCNGLAGVCENHADRAWPDVCECGADIFLVGCVVGFDIIKHLAAAGNVSSVEYLGFAGLMASAALLYKDRQNADQG